MVLMKPCSPERSKLFYWMICKLAEYAIGVLFCLFFFFYLSSPTADVITAENLQHYQKDTLTTVALTAWPEDSTDQGSAWCLERRVARIATGNSHLQDFPSTSKRHRDYRKTRKGALSQRNSLSEQEENVVERSLVTYYTTSVFVLRLVTHRCSNSCQEF